MPKRPHNEPENDEIESGEKPSPLLTHPSYEELMQKLEEAEQKSNQHWERILRMQADNENYHRRTERDIANAHKYALEKFVTELLPIIDSLELCISSEAPKEAKAILEGVELTLKMFYTALEKFGIVQINPLNKPFDPEHEQAISMQYNPKVKPGTVVGVLQKGYLLNNRLVRPALVIVSKNEE
ncbi:MAG: nucleotide exchange factor GrpE [Gammaproteobacteria bacterium]|nr:nucleotide exchange factor GrpE [Gammaproteobacteria bacterium]